MSDIIKFNLKELEKLNTPFSNYILGRSYDLEENGATIEQNEMVYATFVEAAYYNYGIGGVEQNFEKAREILEKCAKLGHIAAYYDLGYKFYREGVGGTADIEKSELFLRIAKNAGLKRAIDKYKEFGYSEIER